MKRENIAHDSERQAFLKKLASSADPVLALDHRQRVGAFIPPRRAIPIRAEEFPPPSPSDFSQPSIVVPPPLSNKQVDFRKEVLHGIPCAVWGEVFCPTRIVLIFQDCQARFDFSQFLVGICPGHTKFVWVQHDDDHYARLIPLLKTMTVPVTILCSGSTCEEVGEAVNGWIRNTLVGIDGVGFFFPVARSGHHQKRTALWPSFMGLRVVLEAHQTDDDDLAFLAQLTRSGAVISRNFHDLFDALLPDDGGLVLTQYCPTSPHPVVDNAPVDQKPSTISTVLCLVCEVVVSQGMKSSSSITARCFRADTNTYFSAAVLHSHRVEEGDVVRIDVVGNSILEVLRKDNVLTLEYLHLVNQLRVPPVVALVPQECITLNDLLSGLVSEGRREFARVLVVSVKNFDVFLTDSSLPTGLFVQVKLRQSLHKPADFFPGLQIRIVKVKIEWRQDRFHAVLDNQSGVSVVNTATTIAAASPIKLHFTQLDGVRRGIAGEYRVRAVVKDVYFSHGISWVQTMRHWPNVFKWIDLVVQKSVQGNEYIFRPCTVLLSDASDDILVHCDAVNEVLPFVDPNALKSDLDEEVVFPQLMLMQKVLNALVFVGNQDFDLALEVKEGDDSIQLLRIDI